MARKHLLPALATLTVWSAAAAHAGVVTGTLVDNAGNPVAGAIFEVQASSGGTIPSVLGGFTDANGNFSATITPDGVYDITVLPLPAPQSLVVPRILHNVNVGATPNNLGQEVLQLGALLTGQVRSVTGAPLVSVDLHFVAAPEFQPMSFRNNETNSGGYYQMVVPYGSCEVLYKPGPVPYYGGPDTAATTRSFTVNGSIDAGVTVMPEGFVMFGAVTETNGTPIDDVEVQVTPTSSNDVLYTPENFSNVAGFYQLTLPAGSYDLHLVPKANSGFAPKVLHNYSVPPAQNLPTVQLEAAVELRGRVRSESNVSCVNATVTLIDATTQIPVILTGNKTDASGHYRMEIPTGTFDLVYSADFGQPFGQVVVPGVVIDEDFDQDAALPDVAWPSSRAAVSPAAAA
ncbi:MAG: carboxypeptidase-like regulatory domain-containing protein [Planctomycetota bacterium]